MTQLDVMPGDILRHLKRGSEYEVIGEIHEIILDLNDGQDLFLSHSDDNGWMLDPKSFPEDPVQLSVRFQMSLPRVSSWADVVLYRTLEPKRGEPWLFARPLQEFTADRFEKVS